MKLSKKTLFGIKNIPISSIYKEKKVGKNSYNEVINKYISDISVRELIYKYLSNLKYNIKVSVLSNQLELLKVLPIDTQIKILNRTIARGVSSLIPSYNFYTKNTFDNTTTRFISKEDLQQNNDIVKENF